MLCLELSTMILLSTLGPINLPNKTLLNSFVNSLQIEGYEKITKEYSKHLLMHTLRLSSLS